MLSKQLLPIDVAVLPQEQRGDVQGLKIQGWWEWPAYAQQEEPLPLKPFVGQVYTVEGNNFSQTFKVVNVYQVDYFIYVDVRWYVNGEWVKT